jgi:hypothetical protein
MTRALVLISILSLGAPLAIAQTPDGSTPAEEDVCTNAGLTGAAWGLCNAYCEAMDCDSPAPNASPVACAAVLSRFQKKTDPAFLPPCEDPDTDGDGASDGVDNCPAVPNGDQADTDADGHGDVCDNCPTIENPGQEDLGIAANAFDAGNGVGDACDCPCGSSCGQHLCFEGEPDPGFCLDDFQDAATFFTRTLSAPGNLNDPPIFESQTTSPFGRTCLYSTTGNLGSGVGPITLAQAQACRALILASPVWAACPVP